MNGQPIQMSDALKRLIEWRDGTQDNDSYCAGNRAFADDVLAILAHSAQTESQPTAEDYLRARYGAYRGHHAWRELEEAFNAGKASQPAPADGAKDAARLLRINNYKWK